MKKILLLFMLVLLTSCAPFNKNLSKNFEIDYGHNVTYCDGYYYYYDYFDNKVFCILKDNTKKIYDSSYITKDNDMIYLVNNDDEKSLIGHIDNANNLYVGLIYSEDEYKMLDILQNDEKILNIRVDINNKYHIHPHVINYEGSIYLLIIKYNNTTYIDTSIAGDDFVNSELYKIDRKTNNCSLIYDTDNKTSIIFGNDKIIYYANDQYDIFQLNLESKEVLLVYDSPKDDGIIVDYTHGKLFIIDSESNIGIIDVE